MEETYEDLVQDCQSGKINKLQFIMAQQELAADFMADMKSTGQIPSIETAEKWLDKYENDNLFL